MDSIYSKLARHLDGLPGGYPPTESGVELRILQRLFTPEEAQIAVHLMPVPEPAEAIARRMGADEAGMQARLVAMSRKGLILRVEKAGAIKFMAAQFVIGIWEFHVNDLDEGLIKDFNEYLPYLTKVQERIRTQQLRVVPVRKSITADIKVMPYEVAEEIIKRQSKIVVAPCICRKEHLMVGEGCGKPVETCLVFGGSAYFYEGNGIGRRISRDEALNILQEGVDAGLVLQPGNAKEPSNICMCCGCCCQVLKMLKRSDKPAKLACTSYFAVVDEESCVGCGTCEDRCQMGAVVVDGVARVDLDRCIGCGLCVTSCDVEAISLGAKDANDQWVPPDNFIETYTTIVKERLKLRR